jgi:hypothetical protein
LSIILWKKLQSILGMSVMSGSYDYPLIALIFGPEPRVDEKVHPYYKKG